ncbi:hypothetical protein EVAR_87254_1 [Eumeta japonica]|uniref:Uncharacterized protein n=1 Tax=Eumeta variegata TaxID=151549 RepID=A0A4C1YR21_EUMVA|nr:hypothetical protein EVAR_87254_1 [Eumeta japonica]
MRPPAAAPAPRAPHARADARTSAALNIDVDLLPPGKIINSDLYCQQLMRLKQEVEKTAGIDQRKGHIFSHSANIERVCLGSLIEGQTSFAATKKEMVTTDHGHRNSGAVTNALWASWIETGNSTNGVGVGVWGDQRETGPP